MVYSPKISIIVPIYNAEQHLTQCIKSIQAQTLKDIEIILIDDGSNDNSLSICKNIAKNDYRIKIYTQNNSGVSTARNLGISKASGEYIGFVDSDDYIAQNMYEKLYNTSKSNNAEICCCNAMYIDNNNTYPIYYLDITEACTLNLNQNLFKSNFHVWRHIFKKEIIKENLFPEIRITEDAVFLISLYLKYKKIYAIPDCLYYYRCNNSTSLTHKINKNNLDILKTGEFIKNIIDNNSYINKDFKKNYYNWILGNYSYWYNLIPQKHKKEYVQNVKKQCSYKEYKKFIQRIHSIDKYTINLFGLLPLLTILYQNKKIKIYLFGFLLLLKIKKSL